MSDKLSPPRQDFAEAVEEWRHERLGCPLDRELASYFKGTLELRPRLAIIWHLCGCPLCRAYFSARRKTLITVDMVFPEHWSELEKVLFRASLLHNRWDVEIGSLWKAVGRLLKEKFLQPIVSPLHAIAIVLIVSLTFLMFYPAHRGEVPVGVGEPQHPGDEAMGIAAGASGSGTAGVEGGSAQVNRVSGGKDDAASNGTLNGNGTDGFGDPGGGTVGLAVGGASGAAAASGAVGAGGKGGSAYAAAGKGGAAGDSGAPGATAILTDKRGISDRAGGTAVARQGNTGNPVDTTDAAGGNTFAPGRAGSKGGSGQNASPGSIGTGGKGGNAGAARGAAADFSATTLHTGTRGTPFGDGSEAVAASGKAGGSASFSMSFGGAGSNATAMTGTGGRGSSAGNAEVQFGSGRVNITTGNSIPLAGSAAPIFTDPANTLTAAPPTFAHGGNDGVRGAGGASGTGGGATGPTAPPAATPGLTATGGGSNAGGTPGTGGASGTGGGATGPTAPPAATPGLGPHAGVTDGPGGNMSITNTRPGTRR